MKHFLLFVMILPVQVFAASSDQAFECRALQAQKEAIVSQSTSGILTEKNWDSIDVIVEFSYKRCFEAIRQEYIELNGKSFYRFRSMQDYCDGGNTYGSIYSLDLKNVIAHIYDGDIYCEDFTPSSLASNHRCDQLAEREAVVKMKQLNFDFTPIHSELDVRTPYAYSFIDVEGVVTNLKDQSATVRFYVNLKNCQLIRPRIIDFDLEF